MSKKSVGLRILFWLCIILLFICGAIALSLLQTRGLENGAGMAFIFFLPASLLGIGAGIVAAFIRYFRPESLVVLERGIGILAGVLAIIGIIGLALMV